MAVQKGTSVIWSVDGITATGILGSGIEQSFSRSISSAQKEIMGDDGECQTLILHNAKADLTVEVIPTSRAAFPALGAMVTVGGTGKRGRTPNSNPASRHVPSHQEPAAAPLRLRQKLEDLTS